MKKTFVLLTLICSIIFSSTSHAEDEKIMPLLRNILNLSVNQSYDLMVPGKNEKELCLSTGILKGYLNSVSTIADELKSPSEVHSKLVDYKCSVTQLQSYCDPQWKPYLSNCDERFKGSADTLKKAKKLVSGIIEEADKAFDEIR